MNPRTPLPSLRAGVTGATRAPSDPAEPVLGILLVALLASLVLWIVPPLNIVLTPIHPYVTFVHESWHALIAILTGGNVSSIQIYANDQGGVTLIQGGASVLVASAGYVGSALTGAVFIALLAHRWALRIALGVQYLWLVVSSILWDHDLYAWAYLLLFGAVLYVLAAKLPARWFSVIAGFLALQLTLAVLGDLRVLLVISAITNVHSDALLASQVTHIPRLVWALIWTAIDALLLVLGFKLSITLDRRVRRTGTYRSRMLKG